MRHPEKQRWRISRLIKLRGGFGLNNTLASRLLYFLPTYDIQSDGRNKKKKKRWKWENVNDLEYYNFVYFSRGTFLIANFSTWHFLWAQTGLTFWCITSIKFFGETLRNEGGRGAHCVSVPWRKKIWRALQDKLLGLLHFQYPPQKKV